MSTAKAEAIRQARAAAKANLAEATELHKSLGEDLPAEVRKADDVIKIARNQTIKFGLMAFLRSSDISLKTEAGDSVRRNLKNIWELH
eukprot:10965699-Lingulodinium_polyedra.AAC.1